MVFPLGGGTDPTVSGKLLLALCLTTRLFIASPLYSYPNIPRNCPPFKNLKSKSGSICLRYRQNKTLEDDSDSLVMQKNVNVTFMVETYMHKSQESFIYGLHSCCKVLVSF